MQRYHIGPRRYRRAGVGADVTRKLRKGGWSIQGQADLHSLRREDPREALVVLHERSYSCYCFRSFSRTYLFGYRHF